MARGHVRQKFPRYFREPLAEWDHGSCDAPSPLADKWENRKTSTKNDLAVFSFWTLRAGIDWR